MPKDVGKRIETYRFWADYIKHLTTLSTGSILLIATFLEKLFAKPSWKPAVLIALLGFLVNVLGSVLAFTMFAIDSMSWEEPEVPEIPDRLGIILGLGMITAWVGFSVGIASLTIFVMKNLL